MRFHPSRLPSLGLLKEDVRGEDCPIALNRLSASDFERLNRHERFSRRAVHQNEATWGCFKVFREPQDRIFTGSAEPSKV